MLRLEFGEPLNDSSCRTRAKRVRGPAETRLQTHSVCPFRYVGSAFMRCIRVFFFFLCDLLGLASFENEKRVCSSNVLETIKHATTTTTTTTACNRRRRRLGVVRKFSTRKSVAAGRADESESVFPSPPVIAAAAAAFPHGAHAHVYVCICMYASGGRSAVLGIDPAASGRCCTGATGYGTMNGRGAEERNGGGTAGAPTTGGGGGGSEATAGGTGRDRRCCALSVFTQLAGGRGGAALRTRVPVPRARSGGVLRSPAETFSGTENPSGVRSA